MPRIDPLKLLTCLKVLLASNGGIRSTAEVKRLAGLMTKYSKKLVSKCIYIQILKCTETELLGQFMGLGGWSLTHMWLNDGINGANWPLVQEILELLLLCPVDVQRLKINTSPKLVKSLCKDAGNEGVRILAAKLVEQWLKVVKCETGEMVQQQNLTTTVSTPSNAIVSQENTTTNESRLPQRIVIESNKLSSVSQPVTSIAPVKITAPRVSNTSVDDPLAVPTQQQAEKSEQVEDHKKNSALVYRLMIKDGKQVLTKVENNSVKEVASSEQPRRESMENEKEIITEPVSTIGTSEDDKMLEDGKIITKESEKVEKDKEKELDGKENKEKDKSRSSKEKDKHRDHRSSSHHKSSSSRTSSSSKSSSSSSSSKSKSSSSSHKSSSSDRDKEKDKHRSSSSSSSSSKDKHRDHRDKERSSKDKDRDRRNSKSKDREREKDKEKSKSKDKHIDKEDKEKEKLEQAEKDKETLSQIAPTPLEKLGRIPKKPKDENDDSAAIPTSITIPSKKASMSIEIRKDTERPKTVKTYNSQFRSHGLTDEVPPPPSRKGLKKPSSQSAPGTSIPPSISTLKRSSPPPSNLSTGKDAAPPAEKKPKIDMCPSPNGSSEKPGAIKLIAPKPKPSTLVESDMFMDALSASACMKKDSKKRKRRSSATKETKDGNNLSSATSPPHSPTTPDKVAAPLKFYQDTLDDSKDEDKLSNSDDKDISKDKDNDSEKNEDEDDIPLKRVKEAIEQKDKNEKDEEEERKSKDGDDNEETEEPPVKKPPGPGCGPNGPPGVLMLHRRKGPKKKLTWRAPEELEEIRYFELDETERVNVTKTFVDMKHMERMNEREAFLIARKLNCEDVMTEQTVWMPLILVDDVPPHPEGNQSKEKRIQAEREQTTLKALYFNRHMIPDSPAEPDMEQYQITEPAVIPLDDITGNPDAVNDFTSMPWPDPKGSPPQGGENDFMSNADMPFNPNQFNLFMPFGQPQWSMPPGQQGPPGGPVPVSNGVIPCGIMGGQMGGFNNMNMNMNIPPNLMMGQKPDDMPPMNMNIGMMPPFPTNNGPVGNFGGPQNSGPFNNFGPPPNMNMNMNQPNFSPPRMDQNMNRGPRGPMGGGNNRGNWRPGGPPNQSGGNWRPQGGNNNSNWVLGNRNRICKQFQRGHCRNGNKCNFLHPTNNHRI